jgi:hypothetical protein
MSDDLSRFVRDALLKGRTKEDIRRVLLEARWPEDAVDKELGAYADLDYPVPVPKPRPYVSAREAFVYLALFSGLYVSAFSLGGLLFMFIEYMLPDPAAGDWTQGAVDAVRWSMSWLFISYPAFLWLSRATHRAIVRDPEKRSSRIRRWLTYLTLFVAGTALAGDLVAIVFNALRGELSLRFILKVFVVAVIAGSVFGYLTWSLRRDDEPARAGAPTGPWLRAVAAVVSVAVASTLAAGLWLTGSPDLARAERLDERRESDLAAIASAIDIYWDEHERLPPSLEDLWRERGVSLRSIEDPQTGVTYEYEPTGERSYRLCATFDAPRRPEDQPRATFRGESRFWDHDAGRKCFDVRAREIDAGE